MKLTTVMKLALVGVFVGCAQAPEPEEKSAEIITRPPIECLDSIDGTCGPPINCTMICTESTAGGCTLPPGCPGPITRLCLKDASCGAGLMCVGGRCVAGCSSAYGASCGCGLTCDGHRCQPGCTSDAGCCVGQSCVSGQCAAGCTTDANCAAGQKCTSGQCVAGCSSDAQCKVGQHCDGHRCQGQVDLDINQSLVVTDAAILAQFPLKAVLDQLIARAGASGQTSTDLYEQWWDTQNNHAHAVFPGGAHCDDSTVGNGFPIQCPRNEGAQASHVPFNPDVYTPVALFNRFDLAPHDGSTCGEYRIVYGRTGSDGAGSGRNLIIFEGALPNPNAAQCLDGCLPVAQFWASQTGKDVATRASDLHDFYFNGLPGFEPIIDASHYGLPTGGRAIGQIRANQFMTGTTTQSWQLREYQLAQSCVGTACKLVMKQVTVKNNPFGPQFADGAANAAFQTQFLTQIPGLSATDLSSITMSSGAAFDGGQSDEQIFSSQSNYPGQLGAQFAARIAAQSGSLTAKQIAERAMTQSCAGCHELSNGHALGGGLTWPESNGFTQIDESSTLSPALTTVFLPHRKTVLQGFLAAPTGCTQGKAGTAAGKATLGGSVTD